MRAKTLYINELHVSGTPVIYTCFGLGSCIALFVVDRVKKLSGGAHIPLPYSSDTGEFLNASQMVTMLLTAFSEHGSDLKFLRAKITGGANVYEGSSDIGRQNEKAVLALLLERKIFVAASDVGGRVSRKAKFNSVTDELQIYTSEQKTYFI